MAEIIPSLKWNRLMICREIGMDARTVGKRLAEANIRAKAMSTRQVISALHGDIDSEKLRLVREQADQVALKNAEARKELVALADIASGLNRAISGIKATIMAASNLEREDKEKILKACGDMWQSSLSGPSQPDESDMESTAAL